MYLFYLRLPIAGAGLHTEESGDSFIEPCREGVGSAWGRAFVAPILNAGATLEDHLLMSGGFVARTFRVLIIP